MRSECAGCEIRAEIMKWVADKIARLRDQRDMSGAWIHDQYTRATLETCWHSLMDSVLLEREKC